MNSHDLPMKTLFDVTGIEADKATLLISRHDHYMLRRLLCLSYAKMAYLDDGELQDCSALPRIDFLRDPPDEIYAKMVGRMNTELSATP